MTSRENRKQRREAERKARKLANKQPHLSPAPPAPSPEPSQPLSPKAAFIAEMRAKADRELDEEFGAEFMAHAREVSDRMARRFGLPLWGGSRAGDLQPKPHPAVNTGFEIAAQQTPCGTENPIPTPRPSVPEHHAPQNDRPATHPTGHKAAPLPTPKVHSNDAAFLSEPKIQSGENAPENRAATSIPVGQTQQSPESNLSTTYPGGHEAAPLSEPKIQRGPTGPRTPEGKLASSRNSLKHGLAAAVPIIPGEDPAAFETLRASLLREHQPADATEQILVDQLAQSYWLLQRALRFQNDCFTLAGIDSKIEVDEKRLALFIRYGSTHERAFHKALNTLLRLKRDRQKAELAAAREFVSQKQAPPPTKPSPTGFVSQNNSFPEPDFTQTTGIRSRKSPTKHTKLPDAA